jgi:hypothetical protein
MHDCIVSSQFGELIETGFQLRWHGLAPFREVGEEISLKRFSHPHAEGVAILAPGEICPQI